MIVTLNITPKILIISLLIFLIGCQTIEKSKQINSHFTITKANYQTWTSGIHGGGSGTEYFLYVKINTNNLLFDSLVIGNESLKLKAIKRNQAVSDKPITYKKGNELTLRSSGGNRYKDKKITIYYKVNNKNFNREIKNIKKIESINYKP